MLELQNRVSNHLFRLSFILISYALTPLIGPYSPALYIESVMGEFSSVSSDKV